MYKKLCGLALVSVVVFAGPAAAQIRDIHVEPYVGLFVPVNEVANDDVLGFGFQVDHQVALAVGGRATTFLRDRWGVQANFVYAFSDADVKVSSAPARERNAYVWAVDGRIVFALTPSVFLSGGLGVISHGDDAYQSVTDGETDLMGALGAGFRHGLGERLALRFDVDSYLYYARPTVASNEFGQELKLDSNFQIDLVLSGGFQFAVSP